MESLLFSLGCVLPLFVLILIGYILRRLGMINDNFVSVGTKVVFNVSLPVQLFVQIASSDLTNVFNPKLILFSLISTAILIALAWILIPRFVKGKAKQGASIQALFRGNFAILGVPLAINMFGQEGAAPASLLLPFIVPFYNAMAVVVLTIFSPEENASKKIPVKKILKGIITNPLIIGIVLGIPFALCKVTFPSVVTKCLNSIANLTTPLALICLGGQFSFKLAKANLKISIPITILKLVVILSIAVAMGFRGGDLGAIFVLYSAPTAVASYVMAKNMHSDDDLAGQILVFTTFFSCFTLFLILFILRSLQLL